MSLGRPAVSAVLLNWNGLADVPAAVEALRRQTEAPAELVVVDNGSTDGSCEWLQRQPDVNLIRNQSNLGFAVAANQAIGQSQHPLVFLCNSDCFPDPGYLAACVSRLLSSEEIGSVTGRLRRAEGGKLDSTGPALHRSGWVSNRGQGLADAAENFPQAAEVFGVSAAAAMYRRSMLEDVALEGEIFPGRLFAYLEDVDLDWRARWRGWRAWYEPGATATHRRGGTGLHRSAAIERRVVANHILVWLRNAPPSWRRGSGRAEAVAFDLLRAGLALRRHPGSWLGGWADAFRLAGWARRCHREIMAGRRVDDLALERWALPTPWVELVRRSAS